MAGQWPERVDSRGSRQPKNMVSFGRAMKPTPSEITVASTAFSTGTGTGDRFENVPPVPPVPKVYVQPSVQDDYDLDDQDIPLSASPSADEQPATPFPDDEDRQKGFDIALARLEGKCDGTESVAPSAGRTHSPLPNDEDRQKSFDIALARLEGKYVEPDDSSISQTEADLASQDRRQNRYEKWLRHQAREAARQEAEEQGRVPGIEVAPPSPVPLKDGGEGDQGFGVRGGMGQDPERLAVPRKQHKKRSHSANGEPRRQPEAGPSRLDSVKQFATPVTPEQRAQAPQEYYPYVADPGCFEVPERKLKTFFKKAEDAVLGPPKPRLYDQMVAQVEADPALKAALDYRAWPSTAESGSTTPRVPATANEAIAQGFRAPPPAHYRPATASHTRPTTAHTHRTKHNPELENPAPGSTWNGNRTPEDIRKPLAPMLPLEEAQKRFMGHTERSPFFAAASTPVRTNIAAPQPTRPIKVVGHPDRGTCFEDFINAGDLPETAEEAFDPTPRPESSRSILRPGFVADNNAYNYPQLSAKFAKDYQLAIDTPQMSPVDLSEIVNGEFPTNKRVLYDPKLSSYVEMPRFEEGYRPSSAEMFNSNLGSYGDRVSKALREDQLQGFRAKNASKQSLAGQVDAGESRQHDGRATSGKKREREGRKHGEGRQQMMPPF